MRETKLQKNETSMRVNTQLWRIGERTRHYCSAFQTLYRDEWIATIRLWWLSQWLVTYGHHLAVTIYLHEAPAPGRHSQTW